MVAAENLFVWNGGNWNGFVSNPVGNAFVAADPNKVQVPVCYAAELARAESDMDFYLIVIARGGTGIKCLRGMEYVFDDGLSGDPGADAIGFDSATAASVTKIRYCERPVEGYSRFTGAENLHLSNAYVGRAEVIEDEANSYITFNPSPTNYTDDGNRTQDVTHVASSNWPPAAELRGSDRILHHTCLAVSIYATVPLWGRYRPDMQRMVDAIRTIVIAALDTRKVAGLDQTGSDSWTNSNSIHVAYSATETIGSLIAASESCGGAFPKTVDAGQYTPTLTAGANVDSFTAFECNWMRVGNVVSVSACVLVDLTASATATALGISLPVLLDMIFSTYCIGTAVALGVGGHVGAIVADAANKRARLKFTSYTSIMHTFSFQFMYRIG